jgi:dTDP-4-dehydrorhamnose 3,5-epimerase
MKITATTIPEVLLLVPKKWGDARGYFVETYRKDLLSKAGVDIDFLQDNQSLSATRGTVRGLHFQTPPHAQAKLVRVLAGSVYDVAVDIRAGSQSYGRWVGATLTAEGGEQLLVPRGFAHGFCTLEPDTIVAYKVDGYYAPECDAGLFWADATLGVDWPVRREDAVVSDKDGKLPPIAGFRSPFVYGDVS